MGTYSDKQRDEIIKEIEVYNEAIREDLYTCIMRHEAIGEHDMRNYGNDGRGQVGNGRASSLHQEESNSNRSSGDESGKYDNGHYSRELDSLGNALSEEQAEYFKDSKVRDADGKLYVVYHGSQSEFIGFAS